MNTAANNHHTARPTTAVALAANQQMIWIGQQYHPNLPLYEMCHAYDIRGRIDVEKFSTAFDQWVQSTPLLRTVSTNSQWEAAVCASVVIRPCEFLDLSTRAGETDARELAFVQRRLIPTEALYDSVLIRVSHHHYRWMFRVHHILTDGLNSRQILKSMSDHYESVCHATPPPSSLQYTNFIDYEITSREQPSFDEHQKWWQQRIEPPADTKFYSSAATVGGPRHFRVSVELSNAENDAFRRLANTAPFRQLMPAMTHFNIFATALTTLLHRLGEHNNVRIGATSHGRVTPAFRETVGLFMQLLPFEVEVVTDDSFADVATKVAMETRGFLQHGVAGIMRPETSRAFDVVLNVIDLSVGDFAGMPTHMDWPHNGYGDPGRKLAISVFATVAGEWQIAFDFNEAIFPDHERDQFIAHFRNVLRTMSDDHLSNISTFNFLTPEEGTKLQSIPSAAPTAKTNLWSQFLAFAEHSADHLAINSNDTSLTYGQLAASARRLSASIEENNAADVVPLLCRRDANAIVGILAVLAAGRCFLPIDAAQSPERINDLLQDCGSGTMVDATSTPFVASVSLDGQQRTCPLTADAAYVLYTSGSTGRPNGGVVGHKSVLNLLEDFERIAPLHGGRCSWWTNVSFDVSIYEIFSALLFGRTLCIPDASIRDQPQTLFLWLQEQQINSGYLPPFLLTEFHAFLQQSNDSCLKRLLVGVEPIPQQRLAAISESIPDLNIVNGYGPTEATVCATLMLIDKTDHSADRASIGRAVTTNVLRVVDRNDQLVPFGVPGELLVGGQGLAKGYLHQPQLTATRFCTDINDDRSTVWYRTGDKVRWNTEGNLQFIGRLDRQLKIRGHRIEPGQLENALLQHPAIETCLACESAVGGKLVAYYTATQSQPDSELQDHLRPRLPDYMIPNAFVFLANIPVTANGKVDLAALPQADFSAIADDDDSIAPNTPNETILARVWSSVLGIERVGTNHNFFDLGGDSISAIQIVSRAAKAGLRVTPAQVFESLTIQQLALKAKAKVESKGRVVSEIGPVPLTPVQQWFFEQPLADFSRWNQSMSFRLKPRVNPKRLEDCFNTLISQHAALRLRFRQSSETWSAEVPAGDPDRFSLQHFDLRTKNGETNHTGSLNNIETTLHETLDIQAGRMLNAATVQTDDAQQQLIIVIHHLSVDAVSWTILIEDLVALYREDLVSEKSTSLREWAQTLKCHADCPDLKQELNKHWSDSTPIRRLPLDLTAPETNEQQAAEVCTFTLSSSQSTSLLNRRDNTTQTSVQELLATALAMTISDWTQSSAVALEFESHGRESIDNNVDVSRTVGWFTTTYPVEISVPKSTSVSNLLTSVTEQLRSIPRNGIGYGLLRYTCTDENVRQQLAANAQPQVLFNYFGRPMKPDSHDLLFDDVGVLRLWRDANATRPYLWEINAAFHRSVLTIDWMYSANHHQRSTIEQLGHNLIANLESLIQLSDEPTAASTSTDFPLANLDASKLKKLSSLLSKADADRKMQP